MATTVRELLVEFGIEADREALDQWNKGVENLRSGFRKVTQVATAASGALVAVGGSMIAQAVNTAGYADEVLRAADNLGLTTQSLQELRFTAERFGSDQADLEDALGTIADRAQDAKDGMASFQDDFDLVNITIDELRGRNPEELFELFVQKSANVEDTTRRVAAAVRIFGDDLGRRLLPILRRGGDGLDAFREEARRSGAVLDREALEASREFQISMHGLRATLDGLRRQLGVELIPVLDELIGRFTTWVRTNQDVIRTRLDEFAEIVGDAFLFVGETVERVDERVQRIGGWARLLKFVAGAVGALGAAWAGLGVGQIVLGLGRILAWVAGPISTFIGWLTGGAGIVAAVGSLIGQIKIILAVGLGPWLSGVAAAAGSFAAAAAVLVAKVLAVAAAIAAVVLIFDDLWHFLTGGESLIGTLVDRFRDWVQTTGQLQAFLRQLGRGIAAVGRAVREVLVVAFQWAMQIGLTVWSVLREGALVLWTVLSGVFRAFRALYGPVFRLLLVLGRIAFRGIGAVVGWLWSTVLQPFVQSVATWMAWLWGGVRDVVTTVGSTIRSVFESVFGWLIPKLEMVGGWVDRLSGMLASLFGVEVQEAAESVDEATDRRPRGGGGRRRRRRRPMGPVAEPSAPRGGRRTDGFFSDFGIGGGGSAGAGASPAAPSGAFAAGGPPPSTFVPGGGSTGGRTEVNVDGGDLDLTIEVPPESDEDRIRDIVSDEFREHRKREKKQIREALVKGGEL